MPIMIILLALSCQVEETQQEFCTEASGFQCSCDLRDQTTSTCWEYLNGEVATAEENCAEDGGNFDDQNACPEENFEGKCTISVGNISTVTFYYGSSSSIGAAACLGQWSSDFNN